MFTASHHGTDPVKQLLERRFGDGQIYVPKATSGALVADAVQRGLMSQDGFITRKGRAFLVGDELYTSVGE